MKSKKIRYIGDTMDPEIKFPPWHRIRIYADTETYKRIPEELKPWEYPGTPEYTKALKASENIPWLLVWTFQSVKYKKHDKGYFRGGGWKMNYSLIWKDAHIDLFLDMQAMYRMKFVPVLLFHNASFDITALIPIWKLLDPDLILYTYVRESNKTFLRGAMESPKFKFKCILEDTMLHENISIETIGIALGKPKGKDVPYDMANVEVKKGQLIYTNCKTGEIESFPMCDYITYAERDVEIQREYGESLHTKKQLITKAVIEDPISYEKIRDKIRGITQGSFAKELVDIYLMQNGFSKGIDGHFRFDIPAELDEFYKQTEDSNMGGYTTFNRTVRRYDCKPDECIYVFDCNSEYPFVLTGQIPFEKLLDEPPVNCNYTTWYVMSFKSCKWKPEMMSLMYIPISHEKIREKTVGKFYMLKEYYDLINRVCDHESTIHEVKYQRTTSIFKPFIDRLYKLRKAYKQQMKILPETSTEYDIVNKQQHGCKIIMNSLYGKLCEKSHKAGCFYYSKTTKYKDFINKHAPLKCILSGSYITYKGRIMLLEKVEKCIKAGFTVLYTDTDSVMFACKKDDPKIKEIFGEDTGDLGQWKCEGEFNLFLNSGVKKKYCLLDTNNLSNYKIAWSGINKAVPKTFENKLKSNDKQALDDLIYIFNPCNNVLFKHQKRSKVLNSAYDQSIIYDADFQMNKRLKKITAECKIHKDGYTLIKYES